MNNKLVKTMLIFKFLNSISTQSCHSYRQNRTNTEKMKNRVYDLELLSNFSEQK